MSIEFTDGKSTLQKREFNLRGDVIRKHIGFKSVLDNEIEADIIIFKIDMESMEASMFLSAWYDDAKPHHETGVSKLELPAYIGSGIGMLARVRLQWPNKLCDSPHLFLTSVSVEDVINHRKSLDRVEIKVFPLTMMDELGLMEGRFRG